MIYFLADGDTKFKQMKQSWNSVKSITEKLKLDSIREVDAFTAALKKGKDIFAYISPYDSELLAQVVLDWDYTEESALHNFYASKEDI